MRTNRSTPPLRVRQGVRCWFECQADVSNLLGFVDDDEFCAAEEVVEFC
ncbi:MAG: hypothetical protein M2R45_02757 [Verrucomicrobia subdivision 3 bacterium]|nr:hypothetical protein [Limisphaerales bacterium]MCS1414306.1 hypothetical protein [Limisphaerales bacterium]